ncbi:hypothetical protein [Runella limosa]|uniref:hypothetical protein n=1 Tax=Runella limosa TaxID=370978 RepID=UPI00040DA1E6|nr:hypothetical protein [Runella limosa]
MLQNCTHTLSLPKFFDEPRFPLDENSTNGTFPITTTSCGCEQQRVGGCSQPPEYDSCLRLLTTD